MQTSANDVKRLSGMNAHFHASQAPSHHLIHTQHFDCLSAMSSYALYLCYGKRMQRM